MNEEVINHLQRTIKIYKNIIKTLKQIDDDDSRDRIIYLKSKIKNHKKTISDLREGRI